MWKKEIVFVYGIYNTEQKKDWRSNMNSPSGQHCRRIFQGEQYIQSLKERKQAFKENKYPNLDRV